jgi:UDP-galactose transporter B1
MAFKVSSKAAKGPATSSLLGMGLLAINLILDGVVNSTQDEVFTRYKTIEGPQMMLFMNLFSTVITTLALLFPTSLTPTFLIPTPPPSTIGIPFNALTAVIHFITTHPTVLQDILLFSIAGAIGQLFIFLTLSLYGSLTLVTITVTRKMMTMLLSVFLFDHEMRAGQWMGVGIVFAGIGVEAEFKRRETKEKRRMKIG